MNKTKIDWADMTWNPVTGCLHGCPYCYARKIANRFGTMMQDHSAYPLDHSGCHMVENAFIKNPYPFGFEPTFHAYRLDEPAQKTKGCSIFVCSMADLFGKWVPDEWIQDVFKACEAAPQHQYLFLTKNPARYERVLDHYFDPNYWFGWSQTGPQKGVSFFTHPSIKTFISIEPLLRPFEDFNIKGVDWVIIGAETGNRKGKVIPQREWIEKIVQECDTTGIPVFMKESLRELMGDEFIQEFPWETQE